jgi:glycosyltransferase involved in cell wall biosynthesis
LNEVISLVSPTYWGRESAIGGGERYVHQLAHSLAEVSAVRWITFGAGPTHVERLATNLERAVLRRRMGSSKWSPFSPELGSFLRDSAVVHTFQYYTLSTFQALAWARRHRVRAYCTDLGGGGWTPGYHVDQSRWLTAHLPLSLYAARDLPGDNKTFRILLGGVDTNRFRGRPQPSHDGSVVFLGRILPHKGIHHLIDAMPAELHLSVIGASGDETYLRSLREQAQGKRVSFDLDADDDFIVHRLQSAAVIAHPTPVDAQGSARAFELLGLAPLEGMACGCVPILSRAASLPELAEEGVSGLFVRPGDTDELRRTILAVLSDGDRWRRLSKAAAQRVRDLFSWTAVADRCRAAYVA